MKVLVMRDGKTARKQDGGVCIINGLRLQSQSNDRRDPFYSVDTRFFQIACPPGTEHEYETLRDGKINLL